MVSKTLKPQLSSSKSILTVVRSVCKVGVEYVILIWMMMRTWCVAMRDSGDSVEGGG